MSAVVYTIGNGKLHQFAMREDGVWFKRAKWRGEWGKWTEHGRSKPHEFGMYLAPRMGLARLPPVS